MELTRDRRDLGRSGASPLNAMLDGHSGGVTMEALVQKEPSAWRLRWDVGSTHVLLWLANPSGEHVVRPEVHLFLADRYGWLARHHRRLDHVGRAKDLDHKAEEHFRLGGSCEPPPAVAVAMPHPRRRGLVEAVARMGPTRPDDAA